MMAFHISSFLNQDFKKSHSFKFEIVIDGSKTILVDHLKTLHDIFLSKAGGNVIFPKVERKLRNQFICR